jgi:hypothetical protein
LPSDPRSSVLVQYPDLSCDRVASNNWDDATVTLLKNENDRGKDSLRLSWTGMDK